MKGKTLYRAVKIGTTACAALAMLILLGRRLLFWWADRLLGESVQFHIAEGAGSIAIIGGADGPTAIYTPTNILPPMLLAGVLTALSVVGCVVLILLRRKNK